MFFRKIAVIGSITTGCIASFRFLQPPASHADINIQQIQSPEIFSESIPESKTSDNSAMHLQRHLFKSGDFDHDALSVSMTKSDGICTSLFDLGMPLDIGHIITIHSGKSHGVI